MDGVTDVPAPPRTEVSVVPMERHPADLWSAFAPLVVALAIVAFNALTYGVALMTNPQSDLFDPLRISITTIVIFAVAAIVFVTIVGIKTSDDAVPPPGTRRQWW